MSARLAKLEALLVRVLERRDAPRPVLAAVVPAGPPTPAPATRAETAVSHAATTPPPPPLDMPAISIPRQPTPVPDLQEATFVSPNGPDTAPHAAESHARLASGTRPAATVELDADVESAPVSSERTIDPSLESDVDHTEPPPESTRQLATSPPPQTLAPESAPRSAPAPVVTRGSLPPDAHELVSFQGAPPVQAKRTVDELLDATFSI